MKKEMKVSLKFDSINGRKKMNFKDESSMNAEVNLSKKMLEKSILLDLDVNVKISTTDKGKTVEISMLDNNITKKSALPTFGTFFSVNIGAALKFYLKRKMEEAMIK